MEIRVISRWDAVYQKTFGWPYPGAEWLVFCIWPKKAKSWLIPEGVANTEEEAKQWLAKQL